MIRITRLVGESYDFESGKELDKGFVLSNGISERQVEATQAQISAVLELFAELASATAQQKAAGSQRVAGVASKPAPQPAHSNGQTRAPVVPALPEEREPGEEYADPETGTQSI